MRTKIGIALVCGLASGLSVGRAADPSPEPPADITCRLDSGTGTLTATGGPRGTLVRIANPGFEGNATITFNGGTPPARLTFSFANLRMMRGFTLSDGKPFTLFFDKKSGLPVKLVAKVVGFRDDEFTQETTFTEYKDFAGIKKATKIESKRNGTKFLEQQISEFKPLTKVGSKTFAEPE